MFDNPVEKTETGLSIDWRWEDAKTKNDPFAICIRRNMFVQAPKFYFFMVIDFVFVVLGTIFAPIAAALLLAFGLLDAFWASWVFAGIAACGVINYWLHPHTQQLAYEAAVQENQMARAAYISGDVEKAKGHFYRAVSLTQPKVL